MRVQAEAYEVGADGRKPDSPVAVAAPIRRLRPDDAEWVMRIGTPFFWTEAVRHRYAVVVRLERKDRVVAQAEIRFGIRADGLIVHKRSVAKRPSAPGRLSPSRPALFVVGDSTASSNGPNQMGWGTALEKLFDGKAIAVLNRARAGRSGRSFIREGLWERVLGEVKAGDVVLIQFGHNDADTLDKGRARGVLPGIGGKTRKVATPTGAREVVHTYGWYLRQMISGIKARGAVPILLALTAKNVWKGQRLDRKQSRYGRWSEQVAKEQGVGFIDLTRLITDRCDALGRERVNRLFCNAQDTVHTSPAGAELNAACLVVGLKRLGHETLLGSLSPKGRKVIR